MIVFWGIVGSMVLFAGCVEAIAYVRTLRARAEQIGKEAEAYLREVADA